MTDMEDYETLLVGCWDGYSSLGWGQLFPLKVGENVNRNTGSAGGGRGSEGRPALLERGSLRS